MAKAITLNCDMGESFGPWQLGQDKQVMPLIDMANIACGFHAGDPSVMRQTVALAAEYGATIGAHPGYPDMQGFGRRSMQLGASELADVLCYQIAALEGIARSEGSELAYVKPHGALYNDMMRDPLILESVFSALAGYYRPLPLMLQSFSDNSSSTALSHKYAIPVIFEAFVDRRYLADGRLTPRKHAGAVLATNEAVEQGKSIICGRGVVADSGETLALQADTLCVHGDTANALEIATELRKSLQAN